MNTDDINAQIAAVSRDRIAHYLGQNLIVSLENGARADVLAQALAQATANADKVGQQVAELADEINALKARTTIPDLSKIDADTLVTEMRNRGYCVSGPATDRPVTEASAYVAKALDRACEIVPDDQAFAAPADQ